MSEIIGDNTFVEDRDDIYYVWQNYFDKSSSLAQFNLDFFIKDEDGSYMRFDEEHIERAYQIEEIESILKEAGFKGIKNMRHLHLILLKIIVKELILLLKSSKKLSESLLNNLLFLRNTI